MIEEGDDYCGVGDDGGLKWRENERWGVVEVSGSAEREAREGIKQQEEGKGSVGALWEVGEEGHVLSMHAQLIGFVLLDLFFLLLSFSFWAWSSNTMRNKMRTQTQTQLGL